MRQCNWMSEQGLWCWWRRLNVRIKDWTRVVCAVSSHVHGGVTIAFQTFETYHLLNQNLKKEEKEKKKRHQRGRASGQGLSTVRVHVSHSPAASQRWSGTGLLEMERKHSCSVRQKKMPPHSDVSWKERSPAVSYSSQTPCARLPGFHQHTLLKWQRSCQKPERPKRSIMHVHSRLGSPSQDSAFQLST